MGGEGGGSKKIIFFVPFGLPPQFGQKIGGGGGGGLRSHKPFCGSVAVNFLF